MDEPGNGVSNVVMMFEGFLEFLYEVFEGSHGDGGSSNGFLPKDSSPDLG